MFADMFLCSCIKVSFCFELFICFFFKRIAITSWQVHDVLLYKEALVLLQ